MSEKIEWYKEVLALEPNSKLFFPLARLLAEAGRFEEALETMRHGLARHGDFLEARIFFIELLYKTGHTEESNEQIKKLHSIFSSYVHFWRAWSAYFDTSEMTADVALSLRFMAAFFAHGPISLHEALDRGINSILDEALPASNAQTKENLSSLIESCESPQEVIKPEVKPATKAINLEDTFVEEEDEKTSANMHLSLRTKEMAEILAEQGDVKEAVEIYQELLNKTVEPSEKAEIRKRFEELSTLLKTDQESEAPNNNEEDVAGQVNQAKVLTFLKALTERVEARAKG